MSELGETPLRINASAGTGTPNDKQKLAPAMKARVSQVRLLWLY